MNSRLYDVAAPKSAGSPEMFFQSLHGLLKPWHKRLAGKQPYLELHIRGQGGKVHFSIWMPDEVERTVTNYLRAAYPGAELWPLDQPPQYDVLRYVGLSDIRLPLQTDFREDPLKMLVSTLAEAKADESVALIMQITPKPNGWQVGARGEARRIRMGHRSPFHEAIFPDKANHGPKSPHLLERARHLDEKARGVGFSCSMKIAVRSFREGAFIQDVAGALRVFDGPNSLHLRRWPSPAMVTPKELAALWHLPVDDNIFVDRVSSPKLPPPQSAGGGDRTIGRSNYPGMERLIGQSIGDAMVHTHVLGPPGVGKSTLLKNLAYQDILAGRGVSVIDPKGDLVQDLLRLIPPERQDDVILLSPNSEVAINPLEWVDREDRSMIADNAVSIFKRLFEKYGWGIRTDDLCKAALLTLLARPDATIQEIPLLFTNEKYRRSAVALLDDDYLRRYFWEPYENMKEGQRQEVLAPLLSRLRNILLNERVRKVICKPHSTFDLDEALDGKILLASLASGEWGEETSSLVGSFLFAKIWQAAKHRIKTPEKARKPHVLYIDEFAQFLGVAQTFEQTLAQARGFRVGLVLANQNLAQLPQEIIHSLSSSARTRIVFQCGQDDARYLAREFAPLDYQALLGLPRYEAVVRLAIDGETSRPFTITTLPPADQQQE